MADEPKLSNREILNSLLQNNKTLAPEIFDGEEKLRPEVSQKLNEIADFIKNNLLAAVNKITINDIVICGNLSGYIYNSKSDLDLAIIIEKVPGAEPLITNLNDLFRQRGFKFSIFGHRVDYGLCDTFVTGSNYSILRNEWNLRPEHQEFTFDSEFFYSEYCRFDAEVHIIAKNLKKIKDSYFTLESCRIMTEYLDYLKENALQVKRHHPEHEYSLAFNLFRGMKHLGAYIHFRTLVKNSINYNHNLPEQNP